MVSLTIPLSIFVEEKYPLILLHSNWFHSNHIISLYLSLSWIFFLHNPSWSMSSSLSVTRLDNWLLESSSLSLTLALWSLQCLWTNLISKWIRLSDCRNARPSETNGIPIRVVSVSVLVFVSTKVFLMDRFVWVRLKASSILILFS